MQFRTYGTDLSFHPKVADRARRLVTVLLVPYVAWLIFAYEYHFIDGVNLLLHEGGHLVFALFGRTMHFLGGTLGQLFFPAAATLHFVRRKAYFDAAVISIWLAESLMYTARYMADAQAQRLPLVGGHIHDWHWLFSRWGLLEHDELIGGLVHLLAALLALAALFVCFGEVSWLGHGRPGPHHATSSGDKRAGSEVQNADTTPTVTRLSSLSRSREPSR